LQLKIHTQLAPMLRAVRIASCYCELPLTGRQEVLHPRHDNSFVEGCTILGNPQSLLYGLTGEMGG
jgi:hypothetical protein